MKLNIDVQTLRSFIKVSELCSFSKAATVLRLTQPAISQQIKRLEELMMVELFVREGRGIYLTPKGEKFVNYAERIIELNDEAVESLGMVESRDVVHLGMPEHFTDSILSHIIREVRDIFPNVQLVVKIARSPLIAELLDDGRADIGMLIDVVGTNTNISSQAMPVTWLASETLDMRSNAEVPLVLFRAPCGFRKAAITCLENQGISWRCAYESEDLFSLRAALIANMGVTVLPALQAYPGLRDVQAFSNLPKLPQFEMALRRRNGWAPPYHEAMTTMIGEVWTRFREKSSLGEGSWSR